MQSGLDSSLGYRKKLILAILFSSVGENDAIRCCYSTKCRRFDWFRQQFLLEKSHAFLVAFFFFTNFLLWMKPLEVNQFRDDSNNNRRHFAINLMPLDIIASRNLNLQDWLLCWITFYDGVVIKSLAPSRVANLWKDESTLNGLILAYKLTFYW